MKDLDDILRVLAETVAALAAQAISIWLPIQLGLIVLAGAVGWGIAALVRKRLDLASLTMGWPAATRLAVRALADNLGTIIAGLVALALRPGLAAIATTSPFDLLGAFASLATAWVVIALLTSLIRNAFIHRLLAITAWTIAALSILGWLEPVRAALDSPAVMIGATRVTPLVVLKTLALMALALWGALALANLIERQIRGFEDLTPSIKVLLAKLIRIGLVALAVLIVLSAAGIDVTVLALFSGALGVGIGLGLQKIVANFFSGLILLLDKSIKPGDVITVGDSFGWVDKMGARYTSVVARDGREFLIPNEDLVTQRVLNWSYSSDRVRLDVSFGVSYGNDPHVVRRLAVEAAAGVERALKEPAPACHLTAFGSSSVEFVLRFWINDPVDGVANVRGAVLLALWDILKREKIEFPSGMGAMRIARPVQVVIERGGEAVDLPRA